MSRSYLITGGAGFIGSHLAEALLRRGDSVVALDNLSTGRLRNLDVVVGHPNFRFVQASVLDELAVDEAVHETDVVVHLAAAVGVKLIVEHPLRSFTTNIRGSEVVLEAAHRYRRKVLIASTSEIYGKAESPLTETTNRVIGPPTVARWAYSVAKSVDEILAFAYHKERDLPMVIVRLFNTVGPRQSPAYGMVMPRLVRQAVCGKPLTVYGDGSQTRCFCHVADVVRALVALVDDERANGEVFNIGSTEEISIRKLAHRIADRTGGQSSIQLVPYEKAYEAGFEDMQRRVPDTSRIRSLVGWNPTFTLDDILDETIAEAQKERVPDLVTGERLLVRESP